jgi:uncharacterized Tic20 family protein
MDTLISGDTESQTRQWGMILHLSMLANLLVPVAGIIAPILIWQLKKNDLPGLDEHGKNAVNWILSGLIYGVIGAITIPIVIGFFILIILGVLSIAFPIVAGIKANNGEAWKYPGAIGFFK